MINIEQFSPGMTSQWDSFVDQNNHESILLHRSYMDYHSDRFQDHSLLAFQGGNILAILPANLEEECLISHQGLTFGGIIFAANLKPSHALQVLAEFLKYLCNKNIKYLVYKQPPCIYSKTSREELEYAFFLMNLSPYRVDTALTIDYSARLPVQQRRMRAVKKAIKSNVLIEEDSEFNSFWDEVLIPNLATKYRVRPVHSLNEITRLAAANKGKIRQFNAYIDSAIVAGVTIFETNTVAHAQYISSTDHGRKSGAIDLLFYHLIEDVFSDKMYFNFGIANENEGKLVNKGLWQWKEGFGSSIFAHKFYKISTESYKMLLF